MELMASPTIAPELLSKVTGTEWPGNNATTICTVSQTA